MSKRVQLWSCGGGRQSAGMAALIVHGRLPKPDHVCMVALEWERRATFQYVNAYIRPAMQGMGIPFTYISRKKYATVGAVVRRGRRVVDDPSFHEQVGGERQVTRVLLERVEAASRDAMGSGAAWMEGEGRRLLDGHHLGGTASQASAERGVVQGCLSFPRHVGASLARLCGVAGGRAGWMAYASEKPLCAMSEPV